MNLKHIDHIRVRAAEADLAVSAGRYSGAVAQNAGNGRFLRRSRLF